MLTARVRTYYKGSMTSNARTKRSRAPAAPAAPIRSERRAALTPIEAWYLHCRALLAAHLRYAPSIPEIATYCGRTTTPVYLALLRCEAKGHLKRNERGTFEAVA